MIPPYRQNPTPNWGIRTAYLRPQSPRSSCQVATPRQKSGVQGSNPCTAVTTHLPSSPCDLLLLRICVTSSNFLLDSCLRISYAGITIRSRVGVPKTTKQPNRQPFGENHEDKIPKGADLSLQGVCVTLGGFFVLYPQTRRELINSK